MKIAIVSGRQQDGTILPRKEQYVWKEICRILKEELDHPIFKGATVFIPIYSKFDLQVLYYADKKGIDIEFYVPSEDWGLNGLPKHQSELIRRVKAKRNLNPSYTGRMADMIADADLIYAMYDTNGVEKFLKMAGDKPIIRFPYERMRYQDEEEARKWHEAIEQETKTYTSLKKLRKTQEERQKSDGEFDEEALDISEMLENYQTPTEEELDNFYHNLGLFNDGEAY